ncbi:hypothetical protein [Peribacillus loiseleuriae]|uniref:hypothetical protein n=1 Tax=Peribacillus loiseleuriae TaxID=1679170 RepID=UPI003D07340B
MFKLKLKNALSYSGVVSADGKNPFVEVKTKMEADRAVATGYFDIVEIPPEVLKVPDDNQYTVASLKKLNKEQQEEVIAQFNGDLESVKNEEERIGLILHLQVQQKAEKE